MQYYLNRFPICESITIDRVERLRRRGWRPGIKAVLYDPAQQVLLGRLPDGYPSRFNLPGGGIDSGESPLSAFLREFGEEMFGPAFTADLIAKAPVIAEGKLPIRRDGFIAKYEFVIALAVPNLQAYQPLQNSKLVCFPPQLWDSARTQVKMATDVKRKVRQLYYRALSRIPAVAQLAA